MGPLAGKPPNDKETDLKKGKKKKKKKKKRRRKEKEKVIYKRFCPRNVEVFRKKCYNDCGKGIPRGQVRTAGLEGPFNL